MAEGTEVKETERAETSMQEQSRPEWVQKRLKTILAEEESVLFEAKGRVELKSASGFKTLLFWLRYILVNTIGLILTLKVKKTAWLAVTEERFIILTNDGVNWPFWVVPFSRKKVDYSFSQDKIASVSCSDNFIFWFIKAKGISLESTGGFSIIFNGMSEEDVNKIKSFLTDY